MSASELEKIRLWWHGPEWLTLSVNSWPNYNVPEVSTQTLNYLGSETNTFNKMYVATNFTKKCKAGLGLNECDNSPFRIDEKRFSSLQKLIRVTSYCVRFIQKRIWSVLSKETQETMSSRYLLIKQVFRVSCIHSMYYSTHVNGRYSNTDSNTGSVILYLPQNPSPRMLASIYKHNIFSPF